MEENKEWRKNSRRRESSSLLLFDMHIKGVFFSLLSQDQDGNIHMLQRHGTPESTVIQNTVGFRASVHPHAS